MNNRLISANQPLMQTAVTSLRLYNYRNYQSVKLLTNNKPVLLTGLNGAGKTNILEAISLLTPGRGLRQAKINEIEKIGATQPWAISAEVNSSFGAIKIGTGRDYNSERRLVRINGSDLKSQSQLAEYLSVVWLTPQMDRLFIDGASARRKFLDRLIYGFDPAHAGRCYAYEKALRQRRKILRDNIGDDIWLNALEAQLSERGIAIAVARREIAGKLDLACKDNEGSFPGANIKIIGNLEDMLDQMPALSAEENFRRNLKDNRRHDAQSGGTSTGAHKSDMLVHHVEKNIPASLCSTGEQKALLVAIIIAHTKLQITEKNQMPILLLDEVAAHLDATKRDELFSTLLGLGIQAWITGTDIASFNALRGNINAFQVENAGVISIEFN